MSFIKFHLFECIYVLGLKTLKEKNFTYDKSNIIYKIFQNYQQQVKII